MLKKKKKRDLKGDKEGKREKEELKKVNFVKYLWRLCLYGGGNNSLNI